MKKFFAALLTLMMGLSLAACAGSATAAENVSSTEETESVTEEETTESPTQQTVADEETGGTQILLTIGDTVVSGTLNDSTAAQDLISRLPYTITMQKYAHDFCAVMPEPLAYDEADQHDGWENGDIDFVTGSNYLALLFNEDDTSSTPHVNLGKMNGDLSFFENMEGSMEIQIELADAAAGTQENTTADTNALIVYYSWSGNTQRIAERLAETVGADIYEIRTVETYPEDGHETAVVSQEERSSGNLPELIEDFPDLSGYSTIYIGAPIWNAYLPTPVESYLETADFTGKTVIPFSTSMGSGQTGFLNDFETRVQNPAEIGTYTDIQFPGNGSPDAYTDEEIDEQLHEWLAENGVES